MYYSAYKSTQARRLGGGGFGGFVWTLPLGAKVHLGKTDTQFVEQVVVILEWC